MSEQGTSAAVVLGGKAAALRQLEEAGFRVPATLYAPEDLAEAVRRLGPPLVVRSSATVEDGRAVSFAGQFRSFLNLWTLDEVRAAVEQCRASVNAPSVVEYCQRHGIDHRSVRMGIIVQRMIQPELAGVAFTVNPVTGAEEVVIEACEGLADGLLLGQTPALPANHPLVSRYRPEIERVARRIQLFFGAPQDIEFAIEHGLLYVLQARPITRIGFAPAIGEWTNADFRDGGVASDVCTPLMWWLYDFIWEDALKGVLGELKLTGPDFTAGHMFFGRPYWNLGAVKARLRRLPGYVEREFDTDLSVQITYAGDGDRTPITPLTVLRAVPTLLAIDRFFSWQERFDRAFLAGGFDALEHSYETMPAEVEPALRRLIFEDYRLTETNYFRTIFAASLAKLDFKQAFPAADYAGLVGALPPMRHLEPTRLLREMAARGETDVTPLLTRFRHRSRRELDIRVPRWDEDRAWVEDLLRQQRTWGSLGGDPQAAYQEARAAALAHLPRRQRATFERKLDRLRTLVWLREEMRDLSSRMYYQIRRHVVEIARQRGLGDDIFFMTVPEILADDRSNIARHRAYYESYRTFEPPNEIGARYRATGQSSDGGLRGIGASQGRAQGIARVARTVDETTRVERDAILVCRFTDPGWTPVLDRVAGVVTETGGLLSHAAVICREYGIPAVLGVVGAMTRLPDGAILAIDGGQGRIDIVTPAPARSSGDS